MWKIPHMAWKDMKLNMDLVSLKIKSSAIKTYKQSPWSPSPIFASHQFSPLSVFPRFSLEQSEEIEEMAEFSTEYAVF